MTTPTGLQSNLTVAERRRLRQEQAAGQVGSGTPESPRMVLDKIQANPENPRESLPEIEELANSIRSVGVTTAVTLIASQTYAEAFPEHAEKVMAKPYVVINGNRRLEAAKLAGLEDIPFIINTTAKSREDIEAVALVENIQRVDLTPMEEARTVAKLLKVYKTGAEVGRKLGKSPGWVSQRLTMMNLKDEYQEEVDAGALKVEDARVLGRAKPEDQATAREKIRQKRAQEEDDKLRGEGRRQPRVPRTGMPERTPFERPSGESDQPQNLYGVKNESGDSPTIPRRRTAEDPAAQPKAPSEARSAACQASLAEAAESDITALLVAAMVEPAPAAEALELAVQWLSAGGDTNSAADFAMVLTDGGSREGRTAALALALAHCELRAAAQLGSESTRAYLTWLVENVNYSPDESELTLLNSAAVSA